jgi:LPXTG-site transpeptidase (sortase) family protein
MVESVGKAILILGTTLVVMAGLHLTGMTSVHPYRINRVTAGEQTEPAYTSHNLGIPKISPQAQAIQSERLVIPPVGVSARAYSLGLASDGKMAVPNNFTDVSWYAGGAYPGEEGTAVIGAHVDNGASTPGVFKKLKNLQPGDKIYFYTKTGEKVTFRVIALKIYDRNAGGNDTKDVFISPKDNTKPRLNLITCYGTFLTKENTYDKRLIVFTELDEHASA